jgi:hypothetical protein
MDSLWYVPQADPRQCTDLDPAISTQDAKCRFQRVLHVFDQPRGTGWEVVREAHDSWVR